LRRQGKAGENGIYLAGPLPNTELITELQVTGVLPYTCEPVSWTEGFSVSVMDACMAGVLPIVSDADALSNIYDGIAHVIAGRPADTKPAWLDAIVRAMTDPSWHASITARARAFARAFDRRSVAALWARLIADNLGRKTDFVVNLPRTISMFVSPENSAPVTPSQTYTIVPPGKLHRLAIILGKMSSGTHGVFDIENLYDSGMLTGTGSGFFDIVHGFAERGHVVDVFCEAVRTVIGAPRLAGANVYPIDVVQVGDDYDAYISINEPDRLRGTPKDRLRVCVMWLNDFSFAQPGFDEHVDLYVCPSDTHARYLSRHSNVTLDKIVVIPLSVSLEFFNEIVPRRPASITYCSSPDRGLHHLLNFFPAIKAAVPEATLRIYYHFNSWYQYASTNKGDAVMYGRAESINNSFEALGRNGENGVHLIGPVPRRIMARELLATRVLAYPCDPVRFTEGFSVSVLDGCAAGCVPIVAAVDALPEVYRGAVYFIPGNPETEKNRWIEAIVAGLTNNDFADGIRLPAKAFATGLARGRVAARWEQLIYERQKGTGPR
jgi:glycosyltransferase involved in cell wall biosynthesis